MKETQIRVNSSSLEDLIDQINKYTETGEGRLIKVFKPCEDPETGELTFEALLNISED